MCMPPLPVSVLPTTTNSQMVVMQIASIFNAVNNFIFSEEVVLPEDTHDDTDAMSNWCTYLAEYELPSLKCVFICGFCNLFMKMILAS